MQHCIKGMIVSDVLGGPVGIEEEFVWATSHLRSMLVMGAAFRDLNICFFSCGIQAVFRDLNFYSFCFI